LEEEENMIKASKVKNFGSNENVGSWDVGDDLCQMLHDL
jgi:hypothetical protein